MTKLKSIEQIIADLQEGESIQFFIDFDGEVVAEVRRQVNGVLHGNRRVLERDVLEREPGLAHLKLAVMLDGLRRLDVK